MIESIELRNVRGLTGQWKLNQKTLVTGPNGSGKSSLAVGAQLALLGYVPGTEKKDAFANASSNDMAAGVKIGKHTILRQWVQGKALSETISVNGSTASKGAADALIGLATNNELQIFDVPAFFGMTATEKRRTILHLVTDDETLAKLMQSETKARDTLNARRRDRQVAEKTMEQITKTLSGMTKPAGNLAQIQKQLAETEILRNEMRDKVSKGEANEAAKKQVETQLKSIPGYEKKLADAKEQLKEIEKCLKALRVEESNLGKPETVEDVEPLPVRAQEVISKAIDDLFTVNNEFIRTIIDNLKTLLTSDEAKAKNDLIIQEWESKRDTLAIKIEDAENDKSDCTASILRFKAMLAAAQKAEKQIENIGPGVDEKDRAALSGLDKQIADLRVGINPLQEVAAYNKQLEQAKLSAEKALAAEETAKNELEQVLVEQQKVVESAKVTLAERSKSILPDGFLTINDDGAREFTVSWDRNTVSIQRQTLSGGEKAIFDGALGYALCPTGLVIVEAAEVDDDNMEQLFDHLANFKTQIIVMTCHPQSGIVPGDWKHIEMERK